MTKHLKTISTGLFVLVAAAGCATPKPVPFQLIDTASNIQNGTIFPDRQLIEVKVDGQLYKGFYIFANGYAQSQTYGGWRSLPHDTVTTYSSNSVRAQLKSENGQHLSCEFLFEGRRAIGECKSPTGAVFQLTAEGN